MAGSLWGRSIALARHAGDWATAYPHCMSSDEAAANGHSMTDDEMVEALRSTFPILDQWRDRLASASSPPTWSVLGELDGTWPYLPPSQMALAGLGTAREHLHAIRKLLDGKELFPSATSTLARTALVGAAHTVWCLESPDQAVRLRRCLTLIREDYRNHKLFADYVLDENNAAELRPTAADDFARLQARLLAVEKLLELSGGIAPHTLTRDVIPIASAASEGDEEFKSAVNMLWRQQSGSAHALVWHHYGQAGTTQDPTEPDSVGEVTVRGSIERVAMDYFCAFRVAQAGFALFDALAGQQAKPAAIDR